MATEGRRGFTGVAIAAAVCAFLIAGSAQAATGVTTVEKKFNLNSRNNPTRFEVFCPSGQRPLGGGFHAEPPVDAMGFGTYPLAYERLGAQDGWHISATTLGTSQNHDVTLQGFCANYKGNVKPVEKVLKFQIDPGQTKTFTAKCPHGTRLLSGGFLTSQIFEQPVGGVYVTKSRALGSKAWQITATAKGILHAEVNPIAYCYHSKKPLIREVASPPASVSAVGASATTTASCPGNANLSAGGFEIAAPGSLIPSDIFKNAEGAWSVTAVGFDGPGQVTGYAYCLTAKLPNKKGHK